MALVSVVNKTKDRQGFTLIESLMVLVICGLILTLARTQPLAWQEDLESRLFFDQLLSQIHLAQEVALVEKTRVSVNFQKNSREVYFKNPRTQTFNYHFPLPDHLELSHSFSFYFQASGHISQFETVHFYHRKGHKKTSLKFQLGSGQFELVESTS